MSQSLSKNLIHLTFSVKDRRPLLRDLEREAFHAYTLGILRNYESPSLATNSVQDHAHILFQLSKNMALASVIKEVKASTSKWLKEQHPWYADFSWQGGYAAFSVSESQAQRVRTYIQNQAAHHQKTGFQDELRRLLQLHHLNYDEHYLWL
jgi:REP element-mobilizing transposase RayT